MSHYHAPLRDMRFVLHELLGLAELSTLPAFSECTPDLADAILDEAAKFASGVLDPLNPIGDREGSRFSSETAGVVHTASGFPAAYAQFCGNGWNGIAAPSEFGGQGLPTVLSTAVNEMWNAANLAFALCSTLTNGAISAIADHASAELQALYLPRLIAGEWTGTMNLTEPQAGSDLAAIRSKAVPVGDGTYRISGTKIFITWGEHDAAENIVHLVLARLPDAPPGVKGISLFLVPKFLPNANGNDGSLGERNDLVCAALEHKLGIHGSPTCVMNFGENGGAIGWLVGQENQGLACMFSMMNHARFSVGLQGLGIGERAFQRALAYAKERVQGLPVGMKPGFGLNGEIAAETPPILLHPDVMRLVLDMKSRSEAMRALSYYLGWQMDLAHQHPDTATQQAAQQMVDFLTPVVKGWCTETGVALASAGIQVHGGMGFIEETGAAQYLRDARITTIYEGTTAIQANDLIGRKLARDQGQAAQALHREIAETALFLANSDDSDLEVIGRNLEEALHAFRTAADWLLAHYHSDIRAASAGAVAFLELTGILSAGWLMGKAAFVAKSQIEAANQQQAQSDGFYTAKLATANFFALHHLPLCNTLARTVCAAASSTLALPVELF